MFLRTESFSQFLRYYPIVSIIIAIHIVLYLMRFVPFLPGDFIFESMLGVNLYIMNGELWRLVTPIFIHAGFTHLLFNSFSLVLFGPALERILGKPRFILLYLSAGVIANIATFILKPLPYVHLGSSGAIFGLFGVYIAMVLFRRDLLSRENSQMILTIVVLGLIMTFLQPNINITAHLFGFLAGFILGSFAIGSGGDLKYTFKAVSSRAKQNQSFTPKSLIWIGLIILAVIGILSL